MAIQKPDISVLSGSQHLGSIANEQNQINVKFFELNIPFTDTEGRADFNAFGKTRIIILQGANSGDGFAGDDQNAKIKTFIDTMESWINAAVQTPRIYTDSFGETYNVSCIDWSWTRSFSDPNRIIYSLLMKGQ